MTHDPLDRRTMLRLAALSPAFAAVAAGASEAQAAASVFVIADITAKPDQTDAFRTLFLSFAAAVRGEPGCVHYAVLEDEQTPGHFFTYEAWADKAALAAHMHAPAIQALGAKAGAMLAKAPSQTLLKTLTPS